MRFVSPTHKNDIAPQRVLSSSVVRASKHGGLWVRMCPLMVDSLYIPFFASLYIISIISGIDWLVGGTFIGKTRGNIYKISAMPFSRYMNWVM